MIDVDVAICLRCQDLLVLMNSCIKPDLINQELLLRGAIDAGMLNQSL